MAFFHFDLTNGHHTFIDDDGVEAASLHQVEAEIHAVLAEAEFADVLRANEDNWSFLIRNEAGDIIKTLPINQEPYRSVPRQVRRNKP